MPTGSRANSKSVNGPSLPKKVRETEVLLQAWHAIRRNGETSRSPQTRQKTRDFGSELPRKIRRIQEPLRRPPYKFAAQIGATPKKQSGKGKRPLVIASIEDRIVQRAILDVLQASQNLTGLQEILSTPTSIGGIPGRGVGDAINLIEETRRAGNANFVAGSDISGFFTRISQSAVVEFISEQTDDAEFVELCRHALRVELANASEMDPDDLGLFPTDDRGVAQGCPLSALAGNIALREFDMNLNGRGIICVRYIDDFILLGRRQDAVARAFENSRKILENLNMSIYSPETHPEKAFSGPFNSEFEFLGYQLVPGIYPPAAKSRKKIVDAVRAEFDEGRRHIMRTFKSDTDGRPLQCFAQSLVAVDALLRAWSGSYSASRCLETAQDIDNSINLLIRDFIAFYQDKTNGRPIKERRKALGIHTIEDDIRRRLSSPHPTMPNRSTAPTSPESLGNR